MKPLAIMAALLALGACNTIQGFGEDLQEGGIAIEEAAEAAQYEEPQPVRNQAPVNPAYY